MNFRMIGQVVGRVLCIEAALMLLPMIAALVYDESPVPFLITMPSPAASGWSCGACAPNPAASPRATVF